MNGAASRRNALGLAAVTLGGLAAAAGEPWSSRGPGGLAEVAAEIAEGRDHVLAIELARWIMDRRPGLRVIDVREGDADEDGAIPTAESFKLTALLPIPFTRAEIVVLYSQADAHAAQAWVLLRLSGHTNILFLRGGLDAWSDDVLHATLPPEASATEAAAFARDEPVRRYFGGVPRHGAREAAPRRRTC